MCLERRSIEKIKRRVILLNMDPHNILKYPVNTEKAVRLMELENKLIFIVDLKSSKKEIKNSFEKLFKLGDSSCRCYDSARIGIRWEKELLLGEEDVEEDIEVLVLDLKLKLNIEIIRMILWAKF